MANVAYTVEDCAAVIRLHRPEKLNAFTFAMIAEIRDAVDTAAADERVVGIIITGTGRAFSAGLDTADLARSAAGAEEGRTDPNAIARGELPALFGYLLRIPKPVLAAINGVGAGGGFVLAMMSDLRFAAAGASFTTAFSKRGLVAEHGTSWILPRIVGLNRALDLLWSARRIDAAEALRIGFVDRIVPAENLLDEAKAYIRDLAASVSPRSLAVMKSQVYAHAGVALDPALIETDRLVQESLDHPDASEGVKSFVERRPPRFEKLKGKA